MGWYMRSYSRAHSLPGSKNYSLRDMVKDFTLTHFFLNLVNALITLITLYLNFFILNNANLAMLNSKLRYEYFF